MKNILRTSVSAFALVTIAACSRSSTKSAMSDDLKKDLASAGGGDMQLAGAASRRLDVVSSSERIDAPVAKPKAPTVAKAPTPARAPKVPTASPTRETPAPQQAETKAEDAAPVEAPQPQPTDVPSAGRPQAPRSQGENVHTSREPRGGWRTPGDIIRRAPFPINP
jgi:hypothetical protein